MAAAAHAAAQPLDARRRIAAVAVRRAVVRWICRERSRADGLVRLDQGGECSYALTEAPAPRAECLREALAREELIRALDALPVADRHLLDLAYFEGLSDSDIAELTTRTPAAVKKARQRALTRLRNLFAPPRGLLTGTTDRAYRRRPGCPLARVGAP